MFPTRRTSTQLLTFVTALLFPASASALPRDGMELGARDVGRALGWADPIVNAGASASVGSGAAAVASRSTEVSALPRDGTDFGPRDFGWAAPAPSRSTEASPMSLMPDGWALDLSAQTSLPVAIGIEAQLTTPTGLFLVASAGHTPNAYLAMLTSIVGGAGALNDDVQPMTDESIANGAWNVRVGVGLNPIEGLELSIGYTYLGANTTLTRGAFESAMGQRFRGYRALTEAPLALEMHAVHGRVGYRFVVDSHMVIRIALGWTHGVAAGARLEVPPVVRSIEGNPATAFEGAVQTSVSRLGFTPELLLSAGYRF